MRWLAPAIGAVVPPRPDRWHTRADADDGRRRDCGGDDRRRSSRSWRGRICVGPPPTGCRCCWPRSPCSCVGVLDDRLQLSPLAKLVASLAIGAFLVFALAGADPDGALPSLYTLVATIWFAGICHAMNLLDNMDGLAAGVGTDRGAVPGGAARRRSSAPPGGAA